MHLSAGQFVGCFVALFFFFLSVCADAQVTRIVPGTSTDSEKIQVCPRNFTLKSVLRVKFYLYSLHLHLIAIYYII